MRRKCKQVPEKVDQNKRIDNSTHAPAHLAVGRGPLSERREILRVDRLRFVVAVWVDEVGGVDHHPNAVTQLHDKGLTAGGGAMGRIN